MRHLYILLMLVSVTAVQAHEDPRLEKRKTYSKSYSLSQNDKVVLSNSFGEMRINTWNKNEVKVDVTIIGKANSEEKAQAIIDKIRIEDGKSGGEVYFKTKVDKLNIDGNNKGKDKSYKQEGMEINYMVYLPEQNMLDASNSFGALVIGDHKGELTLQSKFGSLKAGKLFNVKQVLVEFGKAEIAAVNNGRVVVKFSKASMGQFSGSINSNFEFCDAVDLLLDNSLTSLDVKSSYSTLQIGLAKSLSADVQIKTSFGDVDNNSAFDIKEDEDNRKGPKFDKKYSGVTGKGNAKVTIKSDFGKIKLL